MSHQKHIYFQRHSGCVPLMMDTFSKTLWACLFCHKCKKNNNPELFIEKKHYNWQSESSQAKMARTTWADFNTAADLTGSFTTTEPFLTTACCKLGMNIKKICHLVRNRSTSHWSWCINTHSCLKLTEAQTWKMMAESSISDTWMFPSWTWHKQRWWVGTSHRLFIDPEFPKKDREDGLLCFFQDLKKINKCGNAISNFIKDDIFHVLSSKNKADVSVPLVFLVCLFCFFQLFSNIFLPSWCQSDTKLNPLLGFNGTSLYQLGAPLTTHKRGPCHCL